MNYQFDTARGKLLSNLGLIFGLRRRWFGLEPDFILRRRILRNVMRKARP